MHRQWNWPCYSCGICWSVRPESRRLFFALWPDAQLRVRLAGLSALAARAGGRRVDLANLHLTLAFLGSVDAARQACLCAQAAAIRCPRFTVQLDRFGYWRSSRVLWLGCSSDPPLGLQTLRARINDGLHRCGMVPEPGPFEAHVSLVRKVDRGPRERTVEAVNWPVERFCLVQSHTLPGGAVYDLLDCWPLTP